MGIMPTIGADNGGRTGVYYIYPPCPSALSDNVNGQGGHFVRLKLKSDDFPQKVSGISRSKCCMTRATLAKSVRSASYNANYNANSYIGVGGVTSESRGYADR